MGVLMILIFLVESCYREIRFSGNLHKSIKDFSQRPAVDMTWTSLSLCSKNSNMRL